MKRHKKLDICNFALYYNGWYNNYLDAQFNKVYVHDDFGNLVLV